MSLEVGDRLRFVTITNHPNRRTIFRYTRHGDQFEVRAGANIHAWQHALLVYVIEYPLDAEHYFHLECEIPSAVRVVRWHRYSVTEPWRFQFIAQVSDADFHPAIRARVLESLVNLQQRPPLDSKVVPAYVEPDQFSLNQFAQERETRRAPFNNSSGWSRSLLRLSEPRVKQVDLDGLRKAKEERREEVLSDLRGMSPAAAVRKLWGALRGENDHGLISLEGNRLWDRFRLEVDRLQEQVVLLQSKADANMGLLELEAMDSPPVVPEIDLPTQLESEQIEEAS
ncbi:hypothetical protein VZG28_05260 [Synechococcus elongatus IITB4]|uniref:hypothetical protein n=1 Tax=Synechococcus elongatus TaxID=32046 RepID=UPI0030CCA25A